MLEEEVDAPRSGFLVGSCGLQKSQEQVDQAEVVGAVGPYEYCGTGEVSVSGEQVDVATDHPVKTFTPGFRAVPREVKVGEQAVDQEEHAAR